MDRRIDAVIFDVDGVIWDSTDLVADAYNAVFSDENIETRVTGDDLKQLFGKTMDVIFDILLPDADISKRRELQIKCIEKEQELLEIKSPDFYPGMIETIKSLSERYPLYIVSNAQKGYIEDVIRYGALEGYIKAHLCFGDTGVSKGQTLRILMEREKLEAPVYVGDVQGDADACKEAGIEIISAEYGFGSIEKAYGRINEPRELLKLL